MPSIERHESPYLQVARHLRDKIISGELREGDAVPSAREIVREWDVAMATATKALKTLKDEGIVEAKVGRGTVVSARDTHRSAHDRSLTVMRTGRVYPPGHYAKIVEAGLVTAPQRVANALQVDEGEQARRKKRARKFGTQNRGREGDLLEGSNYLTVFGREMPISGRTWRSHVSQSSKSAEVGLAARFPRSESHVACHVSLRWASLMISQDSVHRRSFARILQVTRRERGPNLVHAELHTAAPESSLSDETPVRAVLVGRHETHHTKTSIPWKLCQDIRRVAANRGNAGEPHPSLPTIGSFSSHSLLLLPHSGSARARNQTMHVPPVAPSPGRRCAHLTCLTPLHVAALCCSSRCRIRP